MGTPCYCAVLERPQVVYKYIYRSFKSPADFLDVRKFCHSHYSVEKFLTINAYSVRKVLTTDLPLQNYFLFYTTHNVEKWSYDSRKLLLTSTDLQ